VDVLPLEASDLGDVSETFLEIGVSPYDCAHAVLMRRYGIDAIVSADRDFERFDWLRRIDPLRLPEKT
jgi:predicted nucleic acid-binding protein